MKFLSVIAASLLATTAVASERQRYRRWPQPEPVPQSTTGTTGTGSTSGMVKVIVVKVSNEAGALMFEPNDIKANAGDMVQFQFYPKNHSVAMSNFANPCVPIEQSNPNATFKFYSGFMPTTNQGQLTYTIRVPDTKPIWFYCSQGKHCQSGMVGSINAASTGNTLALFTANAAKAPQNISPGFIEGGTASANANVGTGTSGSGSFSTPGLTTPGLPQATRNAADALVRPSAMGTGLLAMFAWFVL